MYWNKKGNKHVYLDAAYEQIGMPYSRVQTRDENGTENTMVNILQRVAT